MIAYGTDGVHGAVGMYPYGEGLFSVGRFYEDDVVVRQQHVRVAVYGAALSLPFRGSVFRVVQDVRWEVFQPEQHEAGVFEEPVDGFVADACDGVVQVAGVPDGPAVEYLSDVQAGRVYGCGEPCF